MTAYFLAVEQRLVAVSKRTSGRSATQTAVRSIFLKKIMEVDSFLLCLERETGLFLTNKKGERKL